MENEEGLYEDLEFPPRARGRPTKPYVLINAVASLDGKTSVEGKASPLGTAADRSVMRTLRSKSDAVMVGGGTMRAEKLSLGLDADDPRPRPLAVVLTNSGDLPLGRNLIRDPRQEVLVMLAEGAEAGAERKLGRLAEVRRVPASGSKIDPAAALRLLGTVHGVEIQLCEGGPSLHRALISANLADELFLTLAPALIGQSAPTGRDTRQGAPVGAKRLRLLSAYPLGDEIFLRYALDPRRHPA